MTRAVCMATIPPGHNPCVVWCGVVCSTAWSHAPTNHTLSSGEHHPEAQERGARAECHRVGADQGPHGARDEGQSRNSQVASWFVPSALRPPSIVRESRAEEHPICREGGGLSSTSHCKSAIQMQGSPTFPWLGSHSSAFIHECLAPVGLPSTSAAMTSVVRTNLAHGSNS